MASESQPASECAKRLGLRRLDAAFPSERRDAGKSSDCAKSADDDLSSLGHASPQKPKRRRAAAVQSAIALIRRLAKCAALLLAVLWVAWLLLPKPDLLPPGAEFSRVVLDRDGRVLLDRKSVV